MRNKTCHKCHVPKSIDCFHNDTASVDGKVACCKECVKKRSKAYYDSNSDKIIRSATLWNATHKQNRRAAVTKYNHSQTGKTKSAQYANMHPDKIRKAKLKNAAKHCERYERNRRDYYIENRDALLARALEWQKNNPSRVAARGNRRRARKNSAPLCDFTADAWIAMQEAYQHKCAYCGVEFRGKLTQDHVIPLCRKGSHTESNIAPACRACNCRKHRNSPPPFMISRPASLEALCLG